MSEMPFQLTWRNRQHLTTRKGDQARKPFSCLWTTGGVLFIILELVLFYGTELRSIGGGERRTFAELALQ